MGLHIHNKITFTGKYDIWWTLLQPIAQDKKLPHYGKDRAWEGSCQRQKDGKQEGNHAQKAIKQRNEDTLLQVRLG